MHNNTSPDPIMALISPIRHAIMCGVRLAKCEIRPDFNGKRFWINIELHTGQRIFLHNVTKGLLLLNDSLPKFVIETVKKVISGELQPEKDTPNSFNVSVASEMVTDRLIELWRNQIASVDMRAVINTVFKVCDISDSDPQLFADRYNGLKNYLTVELFKTDLSRKELERICSSARNLTVAIEKVAPEYYLNGSPHISMASVFDMKLLDLRNLLGELDIRVQMLAECINFVKQHGPWEIAEIFGERPAKAAAELQSQFWRDQNLGELILKSSASEFEAEFKAEVEAGVDEPFEDFDFEDDLKFDDALKAVEN